MLNFKKHASYIETSYDRLKSREIMIYNIGKSIKQEFSDGLQISMNIKDITIPLIIHYYLLRAFRTLHKSFRTLNHNVRFLPCQHRGAAANAIRVRAKPCVHVLPVSGHSRREVPRQGWT